MIQILQRYTIFGMEHQVTHTSMESFTLVTVGSCKKCLIGDDLSRFPNPLVGFYNKTHTDDKFILATSPFLITFTFSEFGDQKEVFCLIPNWLVPNLSHGRWSRNNSSPLETFNHPQDKHDCLGILLQDIIDVHAQGGVVKTIFGR